MTMNAYEPPSASKLVAQAWAASLLRDLAIINERARLELGQTMPRQAINQPPRPDSSMHHQAEKSPVSAKSSLGTEDVNKQQIASLAVALGLTACNQSPTAAQPDQPVPTEQRAEATASLDSKYKRGMAYLPFRKMLIADRWEPHADLDGCLKITVGDTYKDTCNEAATTGSCGICKDFREIEACSADGYCYMTFSKQGMTLDITAYGDVLRLRTDGAEPVVRDWKLSRKTQASAISQRDSPNGHASPKADEGTPLPPKSLASKLKQGMPYSQLRAIVLASGWKPVVDPECNAQVVGGDFEESCKAGGEICDVCKTLPELSACGAGGLCMLVFEGSSGQRLNVTGIGAVTTWNMPEGKSEFYAQTWYFEPAN